MSTKAEVDATLKAFGVHGEPMYLRVSELIVDSRYQRPLNTKRVRQIGLDFDPDAIGMLIVSGRSDGTKVILDGQHRKASLVAMGWGDQMVPCFVYRNLGVEDEARIFRLMNEKRARPTSLDLFRTRLAEKDPKALNMQAVLGANGLRVGYNSEPGWFRAINAAMRIYDTSGKDTFRLTIETVHAAWPTYQDPWSNSADMILGTALVLVEYNGVVDVKHLIERMAVESPSNLIGRARSLRGTLGGTIPTCVAVVLVAAYNKGRRTRRLEELAARPWRRNPLLPKGTD